MAELYFFTKKIKALRCKKRKSRINYRALLLLFIFLFENTYPILAVNYKSIHLNAMPGGDSSPVAEAALDMVDLFTGDFNYSVPLMTVPGPNGENVDITASYHGGITVDEQASMLGLGWSLNTGEITRHVVGAPDDYAGQPISTWDFSSYSGNKLKRTYSFGPFYFNKMNSQSAYFTSPPAGTSVITSNEYTTDNLVVQSAINGTGWNDGKEQTYYSIGTDIHSGQSASEFFPPYFSSPTAPFAMPAYDLYNVSGNGISGKLQPYIFSSNPSQGVWLHPVLYKGVFYKSDIRQNPRPVQFHFEGSTHQTIDCLPSNGNDNRIASNTYVKYYTNSDINLATNLFNNSTSTGFLDYHTIGSASSRRPVTSFDQNAIGGIEITNENGFTYHYSLPVMVKSCVDRSFNGLKTTIVHKPSYAISWKLTAITGPDYKDLNNNKVADSGDTGYWVEYKYSLWSKDFCESSLLYGRQNKSTTRLSADHNNDLKYNTGVFSINETVSEKYYIDYIRTSTHTAYFIKDIRLDEHSSEFKSAGAKVNPSLKLNRIVLLKNEDKYLMENNIAWNVNNLNSKFTYILISSPVDNTLINYNKYSGFKSAIDQASLKSTEFIQDYSLCKKYYSNINTSYGTPTFVTNSVVTGAPAVQFFSSINNGSTFLYSSINTSNFTSQDLANSGKLTLNEIRSYEDKAVQVFNPVKFDYRQNNTNKNPDYDPVKKDMWGYYKSDHDGSDTNTGFPTCISAVDVDAWSLSKITLPEGATINVEYESDTYTKEGFNETTINNTVVFGLYNDTARRVLKGPHYIYPIASASIAAIPDITGWENSDYNYTEPLISYHPSTALRCNNIKTTGRFFVVPVLTTFQPLSVSGYTPAQISEAPEFFLGWNGQSAGYGSPNNGRWPDYNKYIDPSDNPTYTAYDKNKYYGYEVQGAKELFGGGLRVKSISFTELESGFSYLKDFKYIDGYCPAPPTQYMLGLAGGNTFYTLWNNTYNAIPYVNLTSIGYTCVETKNTNMFSESNGLTKNYFKNAKFDHNPLLIIPKAVSIPYPDCPLNNNCICMGSTFPIDRQETVQQISKKRTHVYYLNASFSNEEYKQLGLPDKVEIYSNTDFTNPVYKKKFYYDEYRIREAYDISLFDKKKLVNRYVVQPKKEGNDFSTGGTSCTEEEYYFHFSSFVSYGYYLTKITETIDGIDTSTDYYYDQVTGIQTAETFSSPTDGRLQTITTYAFQNPVNPLGLKCYNETNLNKLNEPNSIAKNKGGQLGTFSKVGEKVFDGWDKRYFIRDFNSSSTSTSPQGCYYINTNSPLVSNDIIICEEYEAKCGSNTPATTFPAINFPADYRLTKKLTMFSKNGKVLESYGLNNRYTAVKMGYNNLYPLASINNARYSSFGFTSFEDTVTVAPGVIHYGGEFTNGSSRAMSPQIKAHTGSYYSKVPPQVIGTTLLCRLFDIDRTYEAKVWVHKSSPPNARLQISLNGQTTSMAAINTTVSVDRNDAANIQVGDWILMKCRMTVPANIYVQDPSSNGYNLTPDLKVSILNPTLATDAYFDDLMFGPIDAPITGNVYDPRTGRLVASLDDENFASYFNYDAAGRLLSIYKETKLHGVVKISEREYNNCRSTLNMSKSGGVLPYSPN